MGDEGLRASAHDIITASWRNYTEMRSVLSLARKESAKVMSVGLTVTGTRTL
jgi:hypothetical protein